MGLYSVKSPHNPVNRRDPFGSVELSTLGLVGCATFIPSIITIARCADRSTGIVLRERSGRRTAADAVKIPRFNMAQGTVKWFNIDKGFGFIEPDDESDDVFVHANNISNPRFDEGLREGDKVEFETERTPKGLSAENVTLLDDTLA